MGKLLDLLVKRGPSAFEQFIQALVITDQDNIALMLDKDLALEYIENRDEGRSNQTPGFNQPLASGTRSF